MTKRKKRTAEELRQASDHLYYEVTMFRSLGQVMAIDFVGKGVLHNALLEAFIIHLRVLIEFLYAGKRANQDTVIAEDFFSSPEQWHQLRPSQLDLLKQAKIRVNQEAAHLTYSRSKVSLKDLPWDYAKLSTEIAITFTVFWNEVDEEFWGPLWEWTRLDRN